ncbi:hypothetical protein ABFX02_03G082700 [Erythranthe guttata]
MAHKMVTSFRRSVSFTNPPSYISSKPRKTLHVRSTSLPCRSHPIISQLRDGISELTNSWSAAESGSRTSAWLCDGLRRLKAVHESLDDLLHLPQTRESLRRGAGGCSKPDREASRKLPSIRRRVRNVPDVGFAAQGGVLGVANRRQEKGRSESRRALNLC